jgi:hypothetical protein
VNAEIFIPVWLKAPVQGRVRATPARMAVIW